MDLGLKGKVALVAGASQGMGKAAALGFAREGARVAICARGEAALNEAAAQIRKETGGEVLAIVADMSKADDIKKFVSASATHFGRIDVIVNNAGASRFHWLEETDPRWLRSEVETNLIGPMVVTQRALTPLLAAGIEASVKRGAGSSSFKHANVPRQMRVEG